MAREYKVVPPDGGTIVRVYDEPGVSWREAKKQLRKEYLECAREVRAMREKDALSFNRPFPEEAVEEMESVNEAIVGK